LYHDGNAMQIVGRVYPKSLLFAGCLSLISNADEVVEEVPDAAQKNRLNSEFSSFHIHNQAVSF